MPRVLAVQRLITTTEFSAERSTPVLPSLVTARPSSSVTLGEHPNTEDQSTQGPNSISGQMCQRVGKEQVVMRLGNPRSKRFGQHQPAGLGNLATGDSRQ